MPHTTNSRYHVGLRNAGSYQVSAAPYLTSSLTVPADSAEPLQVELAFVSRFIIITNTLPATATNVPLKFGFSANGVKGVENNNYAILNNGESFEAELKVVDIFLLSNTANECSASVIAGLTGIPEVSLGGNWTGSAGVG
jgi:hypothetical protein|tara:strand:- start:1705 stop:2124 length:420 start_codon:yes stop_codon:yes gene_type:complete